MGFGFMPSYPWSSGTEAPENTMGPCEILPKGPMDLQKIGNLVMHFYG